MTTALCVPCHGNPKFLFAMALADLARTSAAKCSGPFGYESSDLARSRNILAGLALDSGADKILWLDADMTFPPNALERLLAHDKPLVGVNYKRRNPPHGPVATNLDETPLITDASTSGLAPAKGTGLGCFLMDAEVLRRMIRPWFATGTEDYYFFGKARAAGYTVMIDHDLSKEIGHIGENVLKF